MKTLKRVRQNASAPRTAQQAPTPKGNPAPLAPASPAVVPNLQPPQSVNNVTAKAEQEFEDAMSLLLDAGNAAIVALVLQSEAIKWRAKDTVEFEGLNCFGFVDGGESFVRLIARKFVQTNAAYRAAGLKLLNTVYEKRALAAHPEFLARWEKLFAAGIGHDITHPMDCAVHALARAIRHQGEILCNGGEEGAMELADIVADELEAALNDCSRKSGPVAKALSVFETMEAESERKAA